MKKLHIITVGCAMLAMTGCFEEDYSFCPPESNVTLNFCLPGEDGSCVFLANVFSATTAIYDKDGELVQLIESSDSQHRTFKGIKTSLEPGEYRVVSWGNSGGIMTHKNLEFHYKPGRDALVTYGDIVGDKVIGNGNALYYAPNTVSKTRVGTGAGNEAGEYIMNVTEKGHEGDLDFRHAHRRVEIYVKNFNDGDGNSDPVVQLTDLPRGLSFVGMKPVTTDKDVVDSNDAVRVRAEAQSEMVSAGMNGEKGMYAMAAFRTLYFHLDDHEIEILLLNRRTGEVVYSTRMSDHIDPAKDDPESTEPLRLLIEFLGDTDVSVSIPNWKSDEVGYDF